MYCKAKMERNEENRQREVEGVVQMMTVEESTIQMGMMDAVESFDFSLGEGQEAGVGSHVAGRSVSCLALSLRKLSCSTLTG